MFRKIPWSQPDIGKEEINEVIKSFKANWVSQGPKVELFEKKMAKFCNAKYAVAVSNGTAALDIAYKAIGINLGDEVILPAMTYFSTSSMISYQKAIPVFVDINPHDFNINVDKIENAITKKTKAIAFIDYGGNPADINKIKKIARKHNLKVIQDGAQSLGGIYMKKPTGANGDISTMSFHVAKVMTTVEGGMVFTNNKKYYKEILLRRSHGEKQNKKYIHHVLASNARMTDIQAAIGLAQFKKLKLFLKSRSKIAKIYDFHLKDISKVQIPIVKKNCKNAYFFYPILTKHRNILVKTLKAKYGIDTRIAYELPLYKQNLYKNKLEVYKKKFCPVTESVTQKILNLPIYPSLTEEKIIYIVKSIKNILAKYKN